MRRPLGGRAQHTIITVLTWQVPHLGEANNKNTARAAAKFAFILALFSTRIFHNFPYICLRSSVSPWTTKTRRRTINTTHISRSVKERRSLQVILHHTTDRRARIQRLATILTNKKIDIPCITMNTTLLTTQRTFAKVEHTLTMTRWMLMVLRNTTGLDILMTMLAGTIHLSTTLQKHLLFVTLSRAERMPVSKI
ncbi:hypothetical protein BDN70DRAFT_574586 [Pholiota conissans]|uniref:Uncharacterized protein n=1 Tax=Pholiota conissans TaxID=109636 RepID=A0A9P5Z3W9_9AGAR|nr:hypothetical protein BDN70DRAFT_574586 [Pholiota conissans]